MKTCFICSQEKPFSEFYKHSKMADGYLGKCKECTKAYVKARALANPDKIKEYDRQRANLPHRVEMRKEYARTPNGKAAFARAHKKYMEKYPSKYAAHTLTGNAIRDGRLIRQPCEACGDAESEAHHRDYYKPLEVVWLCRKHHLAEHNKKSWPDAYPPHEVTHEPPPVQILRTMCPLQRS
jgi:hypothetical protein